MTRENNDTYHDDDFSFPEEGEYQFDETHDFGAEDDFSYDEDDYGFEEDDGGYVEPELTADTDESDHVTAAVPEPAVATTAVGTKKAFNLPIKGDMKTMIIGGLLGVAFLAGVVMILKTPKSSTASQAPSTKLTSGIPTPTQALQTAPQASEPTVQANAEQQQPPRVVMPAPTNTNNQALAPEPTVQPSQTTQAQGQSSQLLQQAVALNAKSQEQIATLESKNAELTDLIDKLKQQNDENTQQMQQMQQSMTKLAEETQRLHKAMYVLVNAAKQQRVRPGITRYRPAASSGTSRATTTSRVASVPAGRANYYVTAIIPGRAWLKDQRGNVITVGMGDLVSGYGRVTGIDAVNGIVTTSRGGKFEYGIQEG